MTSSDLPGPAPTIETLMTEAPVLIDFDDSLDQAEAVMRATHARHWPVVKDRSLVGILSLRDLLTAHSQEYYEDPLGHPEELSAGQLTDRKRIEVHPKDDIVSAAMLMTRFRLWCLPVVERKQLVGIVTLNHFVNHAITMLHREEYDTGITPTVRRLMTSSPLVSVQLIEGVDAAQALMERCHIRHVLVMNEDFLVGMLSERDILEALRTREEPAADIVVGEIMTSTPELTSPDAAAADAGLVLVQKHIGALPAMRGSQVMGILCKSNFLHYVIAQGGGDTW